MTDTLNKIRTALTEGFERDPVPAAIAVRCAGRVGKPVTKRDVAALEDEFPGVRFYLRKQFGWTEMEWWRGNRDDTTSYPHLALIGAYENRRGVILARTETNVRWPSVEDLKKENGWCYHAADERNAERERLLGSSEALTKVARLIDELALIHAELKGCIEAENLGEAEHVIREVLKERTGEEFKL